MAKYVARRLGLMLVALAGVTLISFLIAHAVPSDPIVSNLGQIASQRPEIVQAFKEKWGLDKPLYVQYLTFLGNLTRGDLGNSINSRRAITKDLKAFLPATIELSTVAVLFALAIGVPLGVVAAIRRESVIDHAGAPPVPHRRLAADLLARHGLPRHLLRDASLDGRPQPAGGPQIASPPLVTGFFTVDSLLAGDYGDVPDAVAHLILPGLVLASSIMGLVTRVTRASMLDVLGQDYVRTARAKGLRERATIARHALRNALIPTVTVLGLAYGGLLSGAVLTETIFAWPGLGRYAFQSAVTNDFPAIMGVTFVIGLMYTMVNFAVDLALRLARPADPVLLVATASAARAVTVADGTLGATGARRCREARAAGSSCS